MAEGIQSSEEKNLATDEDLEELLDDAIGDFDKLEEKQVSGTSKKEPSEASSSSQNSEPWDDEFLQEAQKQLQDNMKALFEGGDGADGLPLDPEAFGSQLQKLAEEANKVFTEHPMDPDFSATLAQSLRTLASDAENIQSQLDPETLSSMLGDLNLEGDDGGNDFMPFMQSMMQSFLSKDMLYPSLKDICSQYPAWLESHKDSISSSEYENYSKQHKLMEDVCKEFEAETPDDTDEVKKSRFGRVLTLMEEVQKLGQPPKDLVAENAVLSENGLPLQMPSMDGSQCSMM